MKMMTHIVKILIGKIKLYIFIMKKEFIFKIDGINYFYFIHILPIINLKEKNMFVNILDIVKCVFIEL